MDFDGLPSFIEAYKPSTSTTRTTTSLKQQAQRRREKEDKNLRAVSAFRKVKVDVKKLMRIYEANKKLADDVIVKPIVNTTTSGVGVYQLDNRTLIIYINTFEPDDYFAFTSTIVEGIFYANFWLR